MEGECRERWARQTDFLPGIRSLDSGRLKYPFSVDKGVTFRSQKSPVYPDGQLHLEQSRGFGIPPFLHFLKES